MHRPTGMTRLNATKTVPDFMVLRGSFGEPAARCLLKGICPKIVGINILLVARYTFLRDNLKQ